MLNEREASYRSEDASNFFNFMTVMINISYILCNVSSGLSSYCIIFLCYHVRSHVVYDCRTNSSNVVLGKCNVLGEAMQPFVHHQHNGVVKIKYTEELRSRYAKFVNHINRVVRECHVSAIEMS